MLRYTVIENTPGYLPDDTDPATFDDEREALRHMINLMRTYRDEQAEFGADITGWLDRDALAGYLVDDGRPHDLGRSFEIVTETYVALGGGNPHTLDGWRTL